MSDRAAALPNSLERETQSIALPKKPKGRNSLSARLLLLTIAFVLLVEMLVLVPEVANFRQGWLQDRHYAADVAVLAIETIPGDVITAEHKAKLQRSLGAEAVYLIRAGKSELIFGISPETTRPIRQVRFEAPMGQAIRDTLATLSSRPNDLLAISGPSLAPNASGLTLIVATAPLREAMLNHARDLIGFSLTLAIMTGGIVYAALGAGFVAPMRALTAAIQRFRANPQDAAHGFRASGRDDEIGLAEAALADMENALRTSFAQRERLAALGEAVSRITHDLRNSLAAAQMVSDRIANSTDPSVRAATPRLERALERAIGLAESTLRYGKAEEAAPEPKAVDLRDALETAADEALAPFQEIEWSNSIPEGLRASVDPDHLHRIVSNIVRNAAQALVKSNVAGPAIRVDAPVTAKAMTIGITDNGPGLPDRAMKALFLPFSSSEPGGTGLGLAIARDLARRNGGDVRLASTGPSGTRFEVTLKQRALETDDRMGSLL